MSVFTSVAKRAGNRIFTATRHSSIATSSLTSSVTTLPSTGANAKLLSTSPILRRSVSSSSQRSTYVDEHDPDSRYAINTERNEYSKSGTDNAVAAQDSAWNIKNQTPESAKEESERESAMNGRGKASPLDVSPANQEVSRFTDESGRGESVVHGPSKRVSPRKGKKVDYGGGASAEAGSGHDSTKM
ncbi:predicted protein [Uncinocarpus reesii 1704]|uniref:Uncharacterized protein n=1 Tax=Uncinocarpus reesii (strain UAMH 1704) TaxID=336963 RepID=C4JH09_UNCRE|nr:uncharacterized protein UREG_01260 [Uncinocarpus reesii 1704]EEP76411.1 predicted protein [Uncinocarpus reesii 1704]